MRLLYVAVGFFLALLAFSAEAEVFAGYDSFCGLAVVVGSDQQVASARTDPAGGKYIHIDPGAMANWTMSRMFTLAHECAHHLLGHTNSLGQAERFYGGTAKQELEADCWAAAKLQSIGYDAEITRTVLERSSEGHFSAGGYPSGSMRAQNIAACAGGTAGVNGSRCYNVQVNEPFMDVQVVMHQVQIPCQHCGCDAFGQCGCVHQFDIATQPVQVPVQRTRIVTEQVCE